MTALDDSSLAARVAQRRWQRWRDPASLARGGSLLAILVFLGYSVHFLNVDLSRLIDLFGRTGRLLAERYFPADLEYVMAGGYLASVLDTVQMAYLGALFGMLLRDSAYTGSATFDEAARLATDGLGLDAAGRRAELVELVRRAAELRAQREQAQ